MIKVFMQLTEEKTDCGEKVTLASGNNQGQSKKGRRIFRFIVKNCFCITDIY